MFRAEHWKSNALRKACLLCAMPFIYVAAFFVGAVMGVTEVISEATETFIKAWKDTNN